MAKQICKIQSKMHSVDEPASYTYVICVDLQGHEKAVRFIDEIPFWHGICRKNEKTNEY